MTSSFTLVPYYCIGTFPKNELTGYSSLIIRANPNHTAAHIVISGLLIALPKMCILHWREICSKQVLSLRSLLVGLMAELFYLGITGKFANTSCKKKINIHQR